MSSGRCSELSRAADEPLAATATTATRWLLVEVPGTWPRDVGTPGPLPEAAAAAVAGWLERTPGSRLHFVRRPGTGGSRLRAFVVRAEERAREIRRLELEGHAELAHVDLDADGDRLAAALVLVCGHGSRDTCCALRGTAVYGALAGGLGPEELWISSHHGGHRFAANVLVLPLGLHFGRVEPEQAPSLVASALAGRIELARYRGRTCYEPGVQAAERAIREAHGLAGVDDLLLVEADGAAARFRGPGGETLFAEIEQVEGPAVPASCGAEPEPQTHFRARVSAAA